MFGNLYNWLVIGCIVGLIIVVCILWYAYEMIEQRLTFLERWWSNHTGIALDTDKEDDDYDFFEGDI